GDPDPRPGDPAAGDSGEFAVDGQHTGLETPPHGSPAPGLPQEAGWHGAFADDRFAGDAHGHASHPGPEDGTGHIDIARNAVALNALAPNPAEAPAEAMPDAA
ncbi:hypothetical protein GTZ78_58555, partial [Streptomyces sp. SID8361]|nr:hypothetical protein [Streptomyces sp. SID8361]